MAAAAPSAQDYSRFSREPLYRLTSKLVKSFIEENYHTTPGSIAEKKGGQTSYICYARLKNSAFALYEPTREKSPVESPTVVKAHDLVLKIFNNTDFQRVSEILTGCCKSEAHTLRLSSDRFTKLKAVIGFDKRSGLIERITNLKEVIHPEETIIIGSEMERGPDSNLFDAVTSKRHFSPKEVSGVLEQLLNALKEIQEEAGLCYRDIKPENILIENPPGIGIQLCDFGFVVPRNPPEEKTEAKLHRKEILHSVGTPNYMAPEILKQEMPWCDTSDAYSAAHIAYVMLFDTPLLNFNSSIGLEILPLLRNTVYEKYDYQREKDLEERDLFGFIAIEKEKPKRVCYNMTITSFIDFTNKVVSKGGTADEARKLYRVLLGLLDHNPETRMSLRVALSLLSTTPAEPRLLSMFPVIDALTAAPTAVKRPLPPIMLSSEATQIVKFSK